MTSPNTEHSAATYGGPPQYPTSQMMPPEFWRKQPAGDPNHKQVVTVDYGDHQVQHQVEPGWDTPVFIGNSDNDPEDD